MAHVAHEMQRLCVGEPLLIGGATTSRVHTAVKIAPHYAGPVVYVPDASRAVGVATSLLSDEQRAPYVAEIAADYERIRKQHLSKKGPTLVPLAFARANAFHADWGAYAPPAPTFLGRRTLANVDLAPIAECIDWGPFFQAWELSGPYPAILDDPVVGEAARSVLAEGRAMLKRVIDGRWLTASGTVVMITKGCRKLSNCIASTRNTTTSASTNANIMASLPSDLRGGRPRSPSGLRARALP